MRIIFDGRWIGRTGIGRYASELLDELQALDHENEYIVLLVPDVFKTWEPKAPNFRKFLTTHEVYTWQEQVLLPRLIKSLEPDLVHFTSFNLPLFYSGKFVVTVHDMTLINFKNVRGSGLKSLLYEVKYAAMKWVLASGLRRAQAVFTPSQFVKDDILSHYPLPTDKIVVTLEAVTPEFTAPTSIDHLNIPASYLLYVGNYYPYKNVGRLVEAFVRTDAYKNGVALVLNGKPNYFLEQIRVQVKELGAEALILFPGYTTDGELAALYRGAEFFVFPSLSEGFGLPGLEAMAQGTPVLAANASCFPEVFTDAAAYFDPYDVADMAEKMDLLLGDKAELASLKAAGLARVKLFSWETMARQTLETYTQTGSN